MSKTRTSQETPHKRRFQAAGANLRRIEREIAPFIDRDEFHTFSTAGRWRETSQAGESQEPKSS
jgi:hypothetical protein